MKKTFRKRGEGPQGFKEWSLKESIMFDVQAESIVVTSQGKISIFRKDGNCEKEIKVLPAQAKILLGIDAFDYVRLYTRNRTWNSMSYSFLCLSILKA